MDAISVVELVGQEPFQFLLEPENRRFFLQAQG
jgi:hypothetical protein